MGVDVEVAVGVEVKVGVRGGGVGGGGGLESRNIMDRPRSRSANSQPAKLMVFCEVDQLLNAESPFEDLEVD